VSNRIEDGINEMNYRFEPWRTEGKEGKFIFTSMKNSWLANSPLLIPHLSSIETIRPILNLTLVQCRYQCSINVTRLAGHDDNVTERQNCLVICLLVGILLDGRPLCNILAFFATQEAITFRSQSLLIHTRLHVTVNKLITCWQIFHEMMKNYLREVGVTHEKNLGG
jgi:hypothetical protein